MKAISFLLLWCLCMTLSLQTSAATTNGSSEKTIDLVLLSPNDGPDQDGKDPITPNQFVTKLDNRVLTIITTLEETVTFQLISQTTSENVVTVNFNKNISYPIEQHGSYVLKLQINNTVLKGLFETELLQDEAADIVLKTYEELDLEIFVSNSIYLEGDTVHIGDEDLHNEYIIAYNRVWVAFVNPMPQANWSHDCQYLLIDANSGKVTTFNRQMPPKDLGSFKQYKFCGWNAQKIINQHDAFAIVDSIYKSDTVTIYISNDFYYGGETFELPTKEVVRVPYPLAMYWVAFVDLHPMANWSHPCEYVFINAYNRNITKVTAPFFPKYLQELFTLKRWDIKHTEDGLQMPNKVIVSKQKTAKEQRNINDSSSSTTDSNNSADNKWAIIINGGYNPYINHARYWNDCSAVYQTLTNNGYLPEHIFVAISDGLDDEADMNSNNGAFVNSPWDLDGDGTNDTQFPATRNGLFEMFDLLRNTMGANDEVFIFTTDHGGLEGSHSTLLLWNNEIIYDFEFASLVESLNAGIVNIVMEQCYSGGFIDDFNSTSFDQLVISTACTANQPSWAMYDKNYDEFIYWWCAAVNGITPDGTTFANADYDNDNHISMHEAYIYAASHDECDESPQQYSNDFCLKFSLTLTELLSLCDSPIMVNGYDLYIKDDNTDIGEEPNLTTRKSWISTDIWFEDANGILANTLQQGNTYKVCARVHNRGNQPTPGGEIIYWHWTKATIGGSWPYSWFEDYEYVCDNTPIIRGAIINPSGTVLPPINGGDSYIAFDYWTVPTIDYSVCSAFEDNLNELWHYCILARIIDSQSQPGEDGSEQQLASFILNNNNVASRNISIFNDTNISSEGLPATIVGVAAPNMISGNYHIHCDLINTDVEFEEELELYLTLSPIMYNNWSSNGWGYIDIDGQGKLRVTDCHAELIDIYMDGSEFYPIKVELIQNTNCPRHLIVDISLIDDNGTMVGGERFIYKGNGINGMEHSSSSNYTEQSTVNKPQIICTPDIEGSTISVTAFDEIIMITVYNAQGQMIISSKETKIDVSNLTDGVYIIKAELQNSTSQTKFIKH